MLSSGAAPAARRPNDHVQSVARAVAILEALAEASHPMSVAELADASTLERTVVYRIAKTLARANLVDDDGGRYQLGSQHVLYANRYLDRIAVRRAALPYAAEIQREVLQGRPWIATIALRVGANVTVIDRVWTPTTPLTVILDIGTAFPIADSAAGRCILAYLPQPYAESLVGPQRFAALSDRLAVVREAGGIDLTRDEILPGVEGVAVTLFAGRSQQPVAALAISGLDMGAALDRDSEIARFLRRAADNIGSALSAARVAGQ